MLVVQRVFGAKRTNLHEKYDYPSPCGDTVELVRDTRVGEPACHRLLRTREYADAEMSARPEHVQAGGTLGKVQDTSGGSSETGTNELMVRPMGAPPGARAVTTQTPVGNWPSLLRNALCMKTGFRICSSPAVALALDSCPLSESPRSRLTGLARPGSGD